MICVIKRDGKHTEFDKYKIDSALIKAGLSDPFTRGMILNNIVSTIYGREVITISEIQELVENELMKSGQLDIARKYIEYRSLHDSAREQYRQLIDLIKTKIYATNIQNQNANVDERSFGGRRGEMASAILKQFALDNCMSEMSKKNHLNNEVYIHDLDSYAIGMHNCLSIPFDDLLKNGFTTRQTDVRPAQSVSTAFQLVAVLMQIQSLQQFGLPIILPN